MQNISGSIKNISARILFLLIFALAPGKIIHAQGNAILANFSVTENDGDVYLSWTILSGNTCDGIRIFRSTDSNSFSQIGDIAGICGSVTEAQNYSYFDTDPLPNVINYYRLELGSSGYSQVLSVELIDVGKNGYQVRPNPISVSGKIYFENNKRQLHQLKLFNLNGELITSSATREEYFEINSTLISRGYYIFTIDDAERGRVITGNIIVQD